MNNVNVVWTAVVSAVCGVASFISALQSSIPFTLCFGLLALTSATLASREK